MKRKKKRPDFNQSEPEFLISCLDRHPDWAVIVGGLIRTGRVIARLKGTPLKVEYKDELHLAVSLRSFRARARLRAG